MSAADLSADGLDRPTLLRLVEVSRTFRMGEVSVEVLKGVSLDIRGGTAGHRRSERVGEDHGLEPDRRDGLAHQWPDSVPGP